AKVSFTPLSVRPLPTRPWHVPGFGAAFWRSARLCKKVIQQQDIGAVVTMGGFVSGPAVWAARRLGVPTLLVNLDAVPGKANRWLGRWADHLFSCFEVAGLGPQVRSIGMPLRRSAMGSGNRDEDKKTLGLDPNRPLFLVTGASQGAASINRWMIAMTQEPAFVEAAGTWQILHLAGADQAEAVDAAYRSAGLSAKVLEFCDRMGAAWGAAELAVSRAGAGSAAEAAANAVPCLYLPYPFHKDQHQRLNVQPLERAGAAVVATDHVDPAQNQREIGPLLIELLSDQARRLSMREALEARNTADGAWVVAEEALRLRV
ncbi:MAG: UDP-N-acetylglucosamine--N-acetylmuramyl-(pentapeptide) pyrophosphoryl-undecaprenol N-acetylglucosamine transferase, partial [Phycisphaeraceae bacterium]|nr:UDP-N-acetylglucosamine--N-acetylmuramyl-(pentapeptide) pyrophosphoryl-undecaprenol N-acetylglucosamine transferase [Phycisphaeraceae bacterium]